MIPEFAYELVWWVDALVQPLAIILLIIGLISERRRK